jgi:hypothetical protein
LTGEKFLQSFVTPIHPAKVFSLVQSGYAANFILELSVVLVSALLTVGGRHRTRAWAIGL